MTPAPAFVERHFSVAEIGGVFWSAVGSGAPHRFFGDKVSERGKRRRRSACRRRPKCGLFRGDLQLISLLCPYMTRCGRTLQCINSAREVLIS